MSNIKSDELFINIKNPPKWDPNKHYFDQTKEAILFYKNERRKITEGANIGGYHMHPWLYFHINFFKTPIPTEEGEEKLMQPPLDDNIFYVIESYKRAQDKGLGLFLFGCRGFTKSTMLASHIQWINTIKQNGVTSVIGGSEKDLNQMTGLIETGFNSVHPAFFVPRLQSKWETEVVFGVKEKSNFPLIHSKLSVANANKGTKKASEKGAGLSPVGFISDEVGKWDWLDVYKSALPSFRTQFGMKLVPINSGCVCAGTKVWDNRGNLVNIEDLNPKEGILGYSQDTGDVSKEEITYWQPPTDKLCYKITTNKGRVLECSEDHPILTRVPWPNSPGYSKKLSFVETKELKVGSSVGILESLDKEEFFGNESMFDPYLVGMLIGDGTYSRTNNTKLFNADQDVLNYVKSKYDTSIFFSADTKDGRVLEKLTIKGITPELRKLGIKGQARDTKTLPKEIGKFDRKSTVKLIEGLYDADGCYYVSQSIPKNRARERECLIKLSSCNRNLLEEVRMLLTKFGIQGNIVYEKLTENSSPKSTRGHYNLNIKTSNSMLKFSETFSPKIRYKRDKLREIGEIQRNHKGIANRKAIPGQNLCFERVKCIEQIGKKPVYNLTAGTTNTYIANGIVTHNTGGNTELSQDARKVLNDPEPYGFLPMDWDLLERNVPKEAITWEKSRKSKFGTFVPGQMSYRLECKKVESNLAKYLGQEDNKDLAKVKIMVTDWIEATKEAKRIIFAHKDEEERNKNRMYYPLETADCFLTHSKNPFPKKVILRKLRELEDEGNTGKDIEIVRDGSKFSYEFSKKERAKVDHPGGVHDAPTILFDKFPEERPVWDRFVSGFDGYKQDESGTDSLGSLYVLKRRNLEPNTPCETIACSYTSRPKRMHLFSVNCEKIVEAFSARCCMESADMGFMQHLDRKGKADKLLAPSFTFSNSKNAKSKLNSRFGLHPNKGNNEYRFNVLVEFCHEEHVIGHDDDGNEIVRYGVEFLDDPDLLREMLNYHKGGNFDRIDAFSHALVYARELDNDNVFPTKKEKRGRDDSHKRKTPVRYNRYSMGRYNRY